MENETYTTIYNSNNVRKRLKAFQAAWPNIFEGSDLSTLYRDVISHYLRNIHLH
jgi:hypothetical protein